MATFGGKALSRIAYLCLLLEIVNKPDHATALSRHGVMLTVSKL